MYKGTGIYGSTKTIQGSRGDMYKGKGIYGSTKTIQRSRGDMLKAQGYMGVQGRFKGVEGIWRTVRG